MARPLWRAATCVAASAIVALAVLPPQHVHQDADHDGGQTPLAHRHLQPHAVGAPTTSLDHPDDETVLYLTDTYLAQPAYDPHDTRALAVVVGPPDRPHSIAGWVPASRSLRTHDPPWRSAHSLRGPPPLPPLA